VKYDGKFASRWRAKSPDALCAVLPKNKEGLPRKMAVPLFEKEIGIYYLRETPLSP
jgi:hypothetical protein